MPPPTNIVSRQRLVKGNDENSAAVTRTTRAKTAAATADNPSDDVTKPAMAPKRPTATMNKARTRAALGDVSNVSKTGATDGKKIVGRTTATKSSQPTGIQKKSVVTRSTVSAGARETKQVETRRSGSGSGTIAAVHKRKASAAKLKQDAVAEEPPTRKRLVQTAGARQKAVDADIDAENQAALAEQDCETEYDSEAASDDAPTAPAAAAASRPELPEGVVDLDKDDNQDPIMVSEYAPEIFEYLRELETKCMPNPRYMDNQDDIDWKSRGILVDWMIDIHNHFHMLAETLFLAVNILDRFLTINVVKIERLQLVGTTALLVASKYEELVTPTIASFVLLSEDNFSEAEILSAERFMLSALKYDLSYPNPMNFLRRISMTDNFNLQTRTLGKYFMEISIVDHRFIGLHPSHVAAGAMYLARLILCRGDWDATLTHYSGYSEDEVEPVCHLMVDYLARPTIHEAFFRKYTCKKFYKVSLVVQNWVQKYAHYFGITVNNETLDQVN